MGFRYRVSVRPLKPFRRTADLVFRPAKVAVFVDGCFWHSCPLHGTVPATNSEYWVPKLARNTERDRGTDQALADAGWLSIRFWEHEDAIGRQTVSPQWFVNDGERSEFEAESRHQACG